MGGNVCAQERVPVYCLPAVLGGWDQGCRVRVQPEAGATPRHSFIHISPSPLL